MKQFFGTCCDNPFKSLEELDNIIISAKHISRKKFLECCIVDDTILGLMQHYPNDFKYYEYKNIMFFTHSMIEHFFKEWDE